ncbi:unnamed protein product [Penicillium salamii]|uniref:DUF6536 domain-containing protein n=1 Tax=Penicillium salamii TaxID=1612424 RepID=A0A9W4JCJ2_9EURO|nr:unnamed protein product [Penicillium salamii]CAG8014993.1 unnamed protein product [Penicillium salamii]CAG8024137.1 unnamed protein product [Penicillium salamii]CAG8088409.1 unnamed protein product [Penicillium salamii]CAG8128935.1 unnamed protein product [Penicillium salamii]
MAEVILNALSTVLLASSNFAMQCLNSPTRSEVELAHAKQRWLRTGAPSIRNLRFISKRKALLWLLLGASSFPLHMIWNSIILNSDEIKRFLAVTVTESFTKGGYWNIPPVSRPLRYNESLLFPFYHDMIADLQQQAQQNRLGSIDSPSCLREMTSSVATLRGSILLLVDASTYSPVESDSPTNSSILAVYHLQPEMPTIHTEGLDWYPQYPDFGGPGGAPIISCQGRLISEVCTLDVIPAFLGVVIVCNALKLVSLLMIPYVMGNDPPLCTTGDIIQSFLQRPDIYTQDRCLATKRGFENLVPFRSNSWSYRQSDGDIWKPRVSHWIEAVNLRHWLMHTFLLVIFLAIIGVFASGGVPLKYQHNGPTDFVARFRGQNSIFPALLLGNVPQVVISYFSLAVYNAITTMLTMSEWCEYSMASPKPAKGLRVSYPHPGTVQRKPYFLSIPLKWILPFIAAMTVIHWATSSVLPIGHTTLHSIGSELKIVSPSVHTNVLVDFRWLMISMSIAAGVIVVVFSLAVFMTFPSGMPLAGCCTASIAAACQPTRRQGSDLAAQREFAPGLEYQKLKWGVVVDPAETHDGVGHATFTDGPTVPLEKGKIYR